MNVSCRREISTVQFRESHLGDVEYVNQLLSSGLTKLMDLRRSNGTVDLDAHADEQTGYANAPSTCFREHAHEQCRSRNIVASQKSKQGLSDPNEYVSPSLSL